MENAVHFEQFKAGLPGLARLVLCSFQLGNDAMLYQIQHMKTETKIEIILGAAFVAFITAISFIFQASI
jgi:hypothetical protein